MPVNKFGGMSNDFYNFEVEVSRLKTYLNNNFLRTDGSKSASGTLNMDTNKISNVVDPLNNQDAATKHYVDTTFVNMFIKMQKDHVQKHQKLLLLISDMKKTLASISRQ